MWTPEKKRKVYWDRIEKGICIKCGVNEALPMRRRCIKCTIKYNQKQRELRCLDPVKNMKASKKWRKKAAKEGKCIRCGMPLVDDNNNKTCANCSSRELKRIMGMTRYQRYVKRRYKRKDETNT